MPECHSINVPQLPTSRLHCKKHSGHLRGSFLPVKLGLVTVCACQIHLGSPCGRHYLIIFPWSCVFCLLWNSFNQECESLPMMVRDCIFPYSFHISLFLFLSVLFPSLSLPFSLLCCELKVGRLGKQQLEQASKSAPGFK